VADRRGEDGVDEGEVHRVDEEMWAHDPTDPAVIIPLTSRGSVLQDAPSACCASTATTSITLQMNQEPRCGTVERRVDTPDATSPEFCRHHTRIDGA
jgi:hypothetical protein